MDFKKKRLIKFGWHFVIYIYLFLCAIMVIYPLVFVVMSSLKDNVEIFSSPFSLPKNSNWRVYYDVWTKFEMNRYFFNSVYYSVISVTISVLFSSMAAYGLVRMRWKFRKAVMGLIMLGLMVPVHSELVPLYIGFAKLGLNQPKISLVGIFVAFSIPMTVFILSGFIKSIPFEMEESSIIEGSSILRTFATIILPLMKPALATVAIFNFLTVWNDFFASLIFISREADKTIQLGITRFQGNFSTRYADLLAAIIIAIVPSIVVYMFMQDKIVSGLTAGAVKG